MEIFYNPSNLSKTNYSLIWTPSLLACLFIHQVQTLTLSLLILDIGMWTKNSNITNFKMMNTTRKGLKRPSKLLQGDQIQLNSAKVTEFLRSEI